ncbi:type I-E CRISPR-associated protein Cas7/Cse4/CasC [Murdochiella massiliensis]|uniref:type I-E CRISPR-associated protein Cas7/Cse4/CasC n=1 Tax=Murdochiella massiliensis TaxID=1673723 RepID=UPI0008344180|nr:type I-E CRISPR-associated protein Cas7/Cse4/CasC [Murdochiella massiliensis]
MRNTDHWFLDVHAIQTLPPSNVNRDDAGSPKTAQYGGVLRARVSSQAWKSVMRRYFLEHVDKEKLGVRTLQVIDVIANKMRELKPDLEEAIASDKAAEVVKAVGIPTGKSKAKTSKGKSEIAKALFFMGNQQATRLAQAALSGTAEAEDYKQILKENPSIDIALFGRMLAGKDYLKEDASAQVAHAISTHAVQTEFDYYAAIDDLTREQNAGAAMLDTVEFNAATYYRYANVAVHELLKQMESTKETIDVLKIFVEAFSNSLPIGMVNPFAHQTVPQALLLILRSDRPVNLVSAFEQPVRSENGYDSLSIKKMLEEKDRVEKFVAPPIWSLLLTTQEEIENNPKIQMMDSLPVMLETMGQELNAALKLNE